MIKLTISRSFRDNWLWNGEHAAWEDLGAPESVPAAGALRSGHMVPILRRWKTRLELRDEREARAALDSLDYHARADGVVTASTAFRAAAARTHDAILEAADEAGWNLTKED